MRIKVTPFLELLFVILIFLSGQFTLSRLPGLESGIQVKYLLVLASPLVFFVSEIAKPTKALSIKISRDLGSFFVLIILYFIVLSFSFFYSIDESMTFTGIVDLVFMALIIVEFIYVILKLHPLDFIRCFSYIWLVIGLIYSLPVFLAVFQGNIRGQSFGGPNVSTRIMFFSVCSSLQLWKNTNKIKYLIFLVFLLAGIFLIGSRGGVVGAISVLAFLLIIKSKKRNRMIIRLKKGSPIRLRKMLIIFLVLFFIILLFDPVSKIITSRYIMATFLDDGTIYLSGRDHLYSVAISYIKENPIFGYGINTFYTITGVSYPHNMLLELVYSIGILGLVFFIIFLLYSIVLIFKAKETNFFWLSGLPLYLIIVQMISGGLYDFRYYYMWTISLVFALSKSGREWQSSNQVHSQDSTTLCFSSLNLR